MEACIVGDNDLIAKGRQRSTGRKVWRSGADVKMDSVLGHKALLEGLNQNLSCPNQTAIS